MFEREYYALDQVLRQLTKVYDEPVETIDLLRLAAAGKLTISIDLVPALARFYRVRRGSLSEQQKTEWMAARLVSELLTLEARESSLHDLLAEKDRSREGVVIGLLLAYAAELDRLVPLTKQEASKLSRSATFLNGDEFFPKTFFVANFDKEREFRPGEVDGALVCPPIPKLNGRALLERGYGAHISDVYITHDDLQDFLRRPAKDEDIGHGPTASNAALERFAAAFYSLLRKQGMDRNTVGNEVIKLMGERHYSSSAYEKVLKRIRSDIHEDVKKQGKE